MNFNALMNPAAIGQQVTQSFQQGQQMRGDMETRNALSTLATDPTNAEAMKKLNFYNPQIGMQMQERQRARAEAEAAAQQKAAIAQAAPLAAQGDKKAQAVLWGLDYETAMKLEDWQAEKIAEGSDYLAESALAIDALPPEQQAMAWDQAIQQGVEMGFDGLARYQGQYSPQKLQAFVAKAGEVKALLSNRNPNYRVVAPGEVLVDTNNPQAVSQFGGQQQGPRPAPSGASDRVMNFDAYQGMIAGLGPERAAAQVQRLIQGGVSFRVSSPEQARQLPSGTPIILPDGSQGEVP